MRAETLLAESASLLRDAGDTNGPMEARWLLSQILHDMPPASHPCTDDDDDELSAATVSAFRRQLTRRLQGEPLQYIMGTTAFHCIELLTGPGVLIPRPETEQLVEIALSVPAAAVCDLCTGSGAIPLAMSKQRPDAVYTGVDISEDALRWAVRNRTRLHADNVTFLRGDLFAPVRGIRYDLITANPPYVSTADYACLERTVRDYEPAVALLGGHDGMDIIRRIVTDAPAHLRPGGTLLLEIGEEQGVAVHDILTRAGFSAPEIRRDYAGKDRFAIAHLTISHHPIPKGA